MEKQDTKGSNPVTGQGQARVTEGGQTHPHHLHITLSFPHFLLPYRLLMTLLRVAAAREMLCVVALTISP